MTDIRQSQSFASFMESLGWQAEKIGSSFIYIRRFGVFGSFAKIPRPGNFDFYNNIADFLSHQRIFHFKISPHIFTSAYEYPKLKSQFLSAGFEIDHQPFNPATSILIDLTPSEEIIFSGFVEAKRRGVRRAIRHQVVVRETDDIGSFIRIRQEQYSPFGFLVTKETQAIWNAFFPKHAALLLANKKGYSEAIAGILLLFHDNISYYWFASATKYGKSLFAPTLLVWEALKMSKKRGCLSFDFEGIYDNRFPKAGKSWVGFTKFKKGFGGNIVEYCENMRLVRIRSLLGFR